MNLREKNVKYARNLLPWLDFQKPNFKVLSLKSFLSHLFINIVVLFSKESYFLRVFSFLRVSVDRILTVFTASNFSNFKSTPKIIALTHFTISVTNRIFWSLVLFFLKYVSSIIILTTPPFLCSLCQEQCKAHIVSSQ